MMIRMYYPRVVVRMYYPRIDISHGPNVCR